VDNSVATSTKNTDFLALHYKQGLNINQILCRSYIFTRANDENWPSVMDWEFRRLSAKLHILAGMNIDSPWPEHSPIYCSHGNRLAGVFGDEPRVYFAQLGYTFDFGMEDEGEPEEEDPDERRINQRNHPTPVLDVNRWARSRVYDLRRYKRSNMWGPFMDDGSGRTDWEKLEAIMVVLAFNYRLYVDRRIHDEEDAETRHRPPRSEVWPAMAPPPAGTSRSTTISSRDNMLAPWEVLFGGIAPNSYVSCPLIGKLLPAPNPDLDALDPYGVTGTWMRIVCFLDYNDLFRFNFEEGRDLDTHGERPPIGTREAFRLIRLRLYVKSIEEQDGVDEEGKPLLPIVHFEGASKGSNQAWDPNAHSSIKGTHVQFYLFPPLFPQPNPFFLTGSVRATPSGSIRWTSFSIFHGEARWRSEGVQIGGLRSARGIMGTWFDKNYDPQGPAGPTMFWKLSDQLLEDEPRIEAQNLMQLLAG
jgi:hypothetical protein